MATKHTRVKDMTGVNNRLRLYTNTPTNKEMFQAIGVNSSTFEKWKKSGSAPEQSIRKIADHLGIRFEWVAYGDGLPTMEIPKPGFGLSGMVAEPQRGYTSSRSSKIAAVFDLLREEDQERLYPEIIALLKSAL